MILGVLLWASAHAAPVTVEAEGLGPEEEVRQELYRLAVAQLVRDELGRMQIDVALYQAQLEKKFAAWFAQAEERLRTELGRSGQDEKALSDAVEGERRKARWPFLGYDKLLRQFSIKSFSAHPERTNHWLMTLEGDLDQRLLAAHAQRILDEAKPFRRLLLLAELSPENFGWGDLKLDDEQTFLAPVEAEWLRWLQENAPADVEEVALCRDACRDAVTRWRARDAKEMAKHVEPELLGSLLLTTKISLSREQLSAREVRMSFTGGVLLHDLNTKQVLHWGDLPRDTLLLKLGDQKKFNSQLATASYRYPLAKFLEAKNQVGRSVALTNALVVRLVNARNLGEALRFIEWVRVRGAGMQAQGKLDSFTSSSARVLIHFRGEGNKFKALVTAPSELESEWGRSVQIDDTGSELVLTLAKKP